MLLTLKARYFAQLLAVVVLVGASPADAQTLVSQVRADDQGIAVAISNYTPYAMIQGGSAQNPDSLGAPGFPGDIPPYRHTGTNIIFDVNKGQARMQYVLYEPPAPGAPFPGEIFLEFSILFVGNKTWDLKAAASDVLHEIKSKASSDAQDSLKKAAEDGGEDAVKLAGEEDGMTEAIETMKVAKAIAKLGEAITGEFVANFGWQEADGGFLFYTGEQCIAKNQVTPAPANVVILSPTSYSTAAPSADNEKFFVVLSALSVNEASPGFVDASVFPMCDYVCAAFNATNEALDDYSQTDCTSMLEANTLQQDGFNAYSELNACLADAQRGPDGVAWVTPPTSASLRWGPTSGTYEPDGTVEASCAQTTFRYPDVTDSVCGTCSQPQPQTIEPYGPWQAACDLTPGRYIYTTVPTEYNNLPPGSARLEAWCTPTTGPNANEPYAANSAINCAPATAEFGVYSDGTLNCISPAYEPQD